MRAREQGITAVADPPLKVWLDREGQLLRLRLARPKANLIDSVMTAALRKALARHCTDTGLKAVLLDAEGPHFSFGASVEEHLPGRCAAMLSELHALILQLLDYPVPALVAVRGQCLGGGMELACTGSLLFATPDAALGQPEIHLGVFAPAASCLLPERVSLHHAEDLLYSGRSVSGEEALAMGLVSFLAADPEAAALTYFDDNLAPLSASTLRFATQAVRREMVERIKLKLKRVETLYLDSLMATHDAAEGLAAFIEKRSPSWQNR